jgi:hypothetical protein
MLARNCANTDRFAIARQVRSAAPFNGTYSGSPLCGCSVLQQEALKAPEEWTLKLLITRHYRSLSSTLSALLSGFVQRDGRGGRDVE